MLRKQLTRLVLILLFGLRQLLVAGRLSLNYPLSAPRLAFVSLVCCSLILPVTSITRALSKKTLSLLLSWRQMMFVLRSAMGRLRHAAIVLSSLIIGT